MKPPKISLSLRKRLLLGSVVVQLVVVALFTLSGMRVIESQLAHRAMLHLEAQKQLLVSAIEDPLRRGDLAAVTAALDNARGKSDIAYLVLVDAAGHILASTGWADEEPLPPPDHTLVDPAVADKGRFDASVVVAGSGASATALRFGLSTEFMQGARRELVLDNLGVGGAALLVSLMLMAALSYWLTRHLTRLTEAAARLAGGDLAFRLPERGGTEVTELARAFNAMAGALQERVRALAESEAKFTAIADYSYDCECWINPEARLTWISPRVFDMFGYTPAECLTAPGFPARFVSEADGARTMRQVRRALRGGSGQDYEFRGRRKDGTEFWAAADWRPIYDARGAYMGIRISIRDITQRKEAEARLAATVGELRKAQAVQQEYLLRAEDEQARLSALLGAMNTGILFVDHDERVVYTNPAFTRIWRIPPGTRLIGRTPQEVLAASACRFARAEDQARLVLRPPRERDVAPLGEIQLLDGRLITQQMHVVDDIYGRPVGLLWLFEDVTRERQTADQLVYLAERDALTGLYNRHRFNEELTRMIADAQRHASRLALLFFDLDDFKHINDTYGHRAGDAMLTRVAAEVGGQVRRNEIFARLGGDEFAILVPDISDEMLRVLAERITRSIALARESREGQNLRLTSSLGIAVYPDHADNAEDLITRADAAMYQAKEAGKNAWRVYRSDLDTASQVVRRLSWNDRILHALEHGLMDLQFQGIYATGDGTLCHFEALVRMRDRDNPGNIFMPGQFVPLAEKSGQIIDIDRWVVSEAIQLLAEIPSIPAVAVNISGRSLDQRQLPRYIAGELARHGVAPARLLVELTETAAVSDMHDAQRFIEALRQTGCGVCLDDFGTGFSSFAYLKHLQVDSIKIDGLFIRDLPAEHDNQLFVKAIVAVARGLRKSTIAECVEDQETLDMLRQFGVDAVQGEFLEKRREGGPLLASLMRQRSRNLELRFT